MYNWMFFPKGEETGNCPDLATVLDQVGLSPVSPREWTELVPETRERAQGPTLGFCCGTEGIRPAGKKPVFSPEIPIVPFVSDFSIEAKCWLEQISFTVASVPNRTYRVFSRHPMRPVITITSQMPDRPPSFRVCGSYCFFGPPYILTPVPPLKI